ncbi:1506_t:CDS:2 [Gigaspora rosea]|nr:1506_t:CDS:2 [Gigaspora rosea]
MSQQIIYYHISTNQPSNNNQKINTLTSTPIFAPYSTRNDLNPTVTNEQINNNFNLALNNNTRSLLPDIYNSPPTTIPPWTPTNKLLALYHQFESKILYNYPHIPCCYCSILMFRFAVHWITFDPNTQYTLPLAFPDIPIYLNENNSKVAICSSFSPELEAVPMFHRKYLSPIRMFCLLGRTSGSNPYTTYRFLKGDISLSRNPHALYLYSGTMNAYLELSNQIDWFHNTLINASSWLKKNNLLFTSYINTYNIIKPTSLDPVPISLPTATQTISVACSSSTLPQLIIPNYPFP